MMTSKAALPYANLISDPLAATICALMVNSNSFLTIKKSKISLIPFYRCIHHYFLSVAVLLLL